MRRLHDLDPSLGNEERFDLAKFWRSAVEKTGKAKDPTGRPEWGEMLVQSADNRQQVLEDLA